jgi:hypothetical protein
MVPGSCRQHPAGVFKKAVLGIDRAPRDTTGTAVSVVQIYCRSFPRGLRKPLYDEGPKGAHARLLANSDR